MFFSRCSRLLLMISAGIIAGLLFYQSDKFSIPTKGEYTEENIAKMLQTLAISVNEGMAVSTKAIEPDDLNTTQDLNQNQYLDKTSYQNVDSEQGEMKHIHSKEMEHNRNPTDETNASYDIDSIDPNLRNTGLDYPFLQDAPDFTYRSLLNVTPPTFLEDYLNPCWQEPLPANDPYGTSFYWKNIFPYPRFHDVLVKLKKTWSAKVQRGVNYKIRCLPYFYIMGFAKCGTSDIENALSKHQLITKASSKEFHYWSNARISAGRHRAYGYVPIRSYINLFDGIADQIESYTNGTMYHPLVVGDASPMTLHFVALWYELPENAAAKRSEGPIYVSAHYIRHITPKAHMIVSVRNPIDRLYSDHRYHRRDATAETFHEAVMVRIPMMTACLINNTLWSCVTDVAIAQKHKYCDLASSMYYPFIEKLLEIFPRDQVHVIRFEDYIHDRIDTIAMLTQALGLGPLSNAVKQDLSHIGISNKTPNNEPMLGKTRKLLQEFFRPYNENLARILGDNKFAYQET